MCIPPISFTLALYFIQIFMTLWGPNRKTVSFICTLHQHPTIKDWVGRSEVRMWTFTHLPPVLHLSSPCRTLILLIRICRPSYIQGIQMWKLVCITVSWTSGLAKESKITAHSFTSLSECQIWVFGIPGMKCQVDPTYFSRTIYSKIRWTALDLKWSAVKLYQHFTLEVPH